MFANNPLVNLLKYSWRYSRGNRRNFVIFIIMSLLANTVLLAQPLVIGKIFNDIQFSINQPGLITGIFIKLSLLVAIVVVFWSLHGVSRVIEVKNAFLLRKNYQTEMIDKVLHLPVAWHKDHHSGDTIDKINKAADKLTGFAEEIFTVITNAVRLFGSIIILIFFDWHASLIAFAISGLSIYLVLSFDKKLIRGYKKIFRFENFLAAAVFDFISNVITIITLRLKEKVNKEVLRRSMLAFPTVKRNAVINEAKWFLVSLLIVIMTVIALGLNAYTSYQTLGVILIGTLFTLYKYLQDVGDTFFEFAWRYGDIVQRNTALLAAEIISREYDKQPHLETKNLPKNWKQIEIRNLSFTYQGDDSKIKRHLSNLNLIIKKGTKTAIVGESGSGKSTLLAILRGLYKPTQGGLMVDNKKMPGGLSHLYTHATLLPQDPEIFNSTIEDNITMDTRVSKADLERAIAMAAFDHVPKRLRRGLKTNVMEKGVSLSGGEKQRLALARGVLAAQESDLIFLDEPTSSVDALNEKQIFHNIFEEFKNKTIIASVHRLHLLRFFDYIYFFNRGRIIAQGPLQTILKNKNFKNLWSNYFLKKMAD